MKLIFMNKAELYTAPEVEVRVVDARQVICQSGSLNSMTITDGEW